MNDILSAGRVYEYSNAKTEPGYSNAEPEGPEHQIRIRPIPPLVFNQLSSVFLNLFELDSGKQG